MILPLLSRLQPEESRMASLVRGSGMPEAELVAMFKSSMAADLSQVRFAARCGDFRLVGSLAHRITGACLLVGAADLTAACASLAGGAKASSAVRVAAALDLFERGMAVMERRAFPTPAANVPRAR